MVNAKVTVIPSFMIYVPFIVDTELQLYSRNYKCLQKLLQKSVTDKLPTRESEKDIFIMRG